MNEDYQKSITKYKDVWIFVEVREGKINELTYELLSVGRRLANDSNEKLCILMIGDYQEKDIQQLCQYDIDEIYCYFVKGDLVWDENVISEIAVKICKEYYPNILLIGATNMGRAIAPRIAAKLGTGLTADCTKLSIQEGSSSILIQSRPALGGNIIADIVCVNHRPQIATVRKNIFEHRVPKPNAGKTKVNACTIDIDESVLVQKITEFKEYSIDAYTDFDGVDIVIAGGRGIPTREDFSYLEKLSEKLNGKLAVTRPIVDRGWYPKEYMIGQTGKSIRPKIYLAFGISGALQHMAGVKAKYIIAINRDKEANIFNYASYGIVGDALAIAKEMIATNTSVI